MRVRKPGKIREGLWFLGSEESCVYLLEGNKDSMIVSGGMAYLVPDLLSQFQEFHINEMRIRSLLILHSHFDHVGIIPFFKRRNPDLKIYASERAWEILQMQNPLDTINEFSRAAARHMGKEQVYSTYDLDWREEIVGLTVYEGDSLDLGDLEVRIFETPGHSSCALSAYVPKLKALLASDSAGIPYKEMLITSGNSNFTAYQRSLEKLKDLDVEYACADHYGYMLGEEAETLIDDTIRNARLFRASVEDIYLRTVNIEATAREMINSFYSENRDYIIPPEILEAVYRQMVRHIADAMVALPGKKRTREG
jgi:glyoxylase-like metal-dependent hydrolase (beta-lactamase superfamily II)